MTGHALRSLLFLLLVNSVAIAQNASILGPPIAPVDAPISMSQIIVFPAAPSAALAALGAPVMSSQDVVETKGSATFKAPPVLLITELPAFAGTRTLQASIENAVGLPGPNVAATDPARSQGRFWVSAEALLWWMKPANLPPLVTASPPGTPRANVGVLGAPGTEVLFGGHVNGDMTVGGRLTAGYWLDCEQTCAIEGYFFQLGSRAGRFGAGSPGNIGRPLFNTATGLPDAELVSLPGFLNGTVQANATSGNLLGGGVLARHNLCCNCYYRLDALIGYRYLSLGDDVGISENLTSVDPTQTAALLGTNILVADNFRTTNQFHGAELGLTGEFRHNAWSLNPTVRLGLGATHERVDINGYTTVTVPGFPPVTNPGGLLALSSNSGIHTQNVFAVVPEVQIRLAYQLTQCIRIFAEYDVLYWSRVARAGDQIDLQVNPALIPPMTLGASPQRPAFTFQSTGFWAQGVNFGLDFRF